MLNKTIVLGITGGIAAYKAADIASKLTQAGAKVEVIMTESATRFIAPLTLRNLTDNTGLVLSLIEDYEEAPLPEGERAMVEYAVQLTEEPCSVLEEDIDHLRDLGFSDKELLAIVQTVAYFNLVNRITSGLGVELERRWFEEGPWREIVDLALQRSSF